MSQSAQPVPLFFLYGEPRRSVGPRFLHLESLEERSRPGDWAIRPHAHAELHHLFLITHGSGRMDADGRMSRFAGDTVLTVPARTVHGFAWEPETRGQVLTLADVYLRDLLVREPAFGSLFCAAACLGSPNTAEFSGQMARLSRELAWSAPGHAAAVDAQLLLILVAALRLQTLSVRTPARPSRAAGLVARFRELVEARYRSGLTISAYAAFLGVTPSALRRACALVAGCSPVDIVQDRLFLEAQRSLLYTNMSVGEVALTLGFSDNAYFSRFFTARAGQSPRRFRESL